jgi:hypothetical protein
MACYGDSFSILYVADVCTSLEAHAFTTCYGDSFSILYAADVCTSLEAHAFTTCYGDSFSILYVADVCTSACFFIWNSISETGFCHRPEIKSYWFEQSQ